MLIWANAEIYMLLSLGYEAFRKYSRTLLITPPLRLSESGLISEVAVLMRLSESTKIDVGPTGLINKVP